MKTLKQWELPNGATVKLPDGKLATFLGMDGRWDIKGEFIIGNYDGFINVGGYYEVVEDDDDAENSKWQSFEDGISGII